jgi:hypothetical protein
MPSIGRLEQVPLRELWSNEARDFTTWLSENLDFLGDALGFELALVEREATAGAFSCDILAEDEAGNAIIIENQLERTDHDHLGKLVTYLSNLDAKTAVWITSDPRPEHEQAIHWLNEVVPADIGFFLVKLQAYRIGSSPLAPLLSVVAGPNLAASIAGSQKKELAERHLVRKEFWSELLEHANQITPLHAGRSPSTDTWLNAGAGRTGLAYQYRVRADDSQVGLRIRGDTIEETWRLFDQLSARKEAIEQAYGTSLEWVRGEDSRTSIIRQVFDGGGWRDRDRWPAIQDRMIDAMVRLEQALAPEIERL